MQAHPYQSSLAPEKLQPKEIKILFPHQKLKKLKEDRFSIVEVIPLLKLILHLKMVVSAGHQFLQELLQEHMKLMSLEMENQLYLEKLY